jgi:uncharacterized protein (DUF433 family)
VVERLPSVESGVRRVGARLRVEVTSWRSTAWDVRDRLTSRRSEGWTIRWKSSRSEVCSCWYASEMAPDLLSRITHDRAVMGGRPCIRGMRVTVGTILGLLASGHSGDAVIAAYPYLEQEDIRAALAYAARHSEEIEVPLRAS